MDTSNEKIQLYSRKHLSGEHHRCRPCIWGNELRRKLDSEAIYGIWFSCRSFFKSWRETKHLKMVREVGNHKKIRKSKQDIKSKISNPLFDLLDFGKTGLIMYCFEPHTRLELLGSRKLNNFFASFLRNQLFQGAVLQAYKLTAQLAVNSTGLLYSSFAHAFENQV